MLGKLYTNCKFNAKNPVLHPTLHGQGTLEARHSSFQFWGIGLSIHRQTSNFISLSVFKNIEFQVLTKISCYEKILICFSFFPTYRWNYKSIKQQIWSDKSKFPHHTCLWEEIIIDSNQVTNSISSKTNCPN